MRKLIFTLIFLVFILSGCSEKVEIEDRDFAIAIGIDIVGNNYQVTYGFPDLSAVTGQGGKEDKEFFYSIKAPSIVEANNKYNKQSAKRLDFGHLKSIILGDTILSNQDKFKEVLSYFEKENSIARTTLVFTTEGEAKELIKLDKNVKGSIGLYIFDLYNNNIKAGGTIHENLGQILNKSSSENSVNILPKLVISDKVPKASGGALIKNLKLIKFIDDRELENLSIARGKGKGTVFTLNTGNGNNLTFELIEIGSKYKFVETGGTLKVVVNLKGKAKIPSNALYNDEELFKEENIKKVETELNKLISRQIKNNIAILQKENVDFINILDILGLKKRKSWIKYHDKWSEVYPTIIFEVYSNVKVNR